LDKKKTKKKISHSRRHLIQALGAVVFNGNFKGFISGSIYTGNLKTICVPVLNCYSCPGALGACPIGSLQAIAGSAKFNFSFYVFGLIALFGILLGRFFCGYLCPFGLLQDLLHKIPTPKIKVPAKLNRILSFGKYVMLIGVVMLLPFIARNSFGMSDPYFCKYVCPVGTIGGGIPLVVLNPAMREAAGSLFIWKVTLAIAILVLSVFLYRVFCRYLCPLGAFYGILQPVSFYLFKINDKCIDCGKCARICKMGVDPVKTPNSPECIRCRDCIHKCPTGAIESCFGFKPSKETSEEESHG
jgi:ferredoxin-type protein NapH